MLIIRLTKIGPEQFKLRAVYVPAQKHDPDMQATYKTAADARDQAEWMTKQSTEESVIHDLIPKA